MLILLQYNIKFDQIYIKFDQIYIKFDQIYEISLLIVIWILKYQ
jgi:hypothetical protein